MSNVNVTLKRYNGAADDIILPTTALSQVYQTYLGEGDGGNVLLNSYLNSTFLNVNTRGAANGVASLDSSGKMLYSEMPDGVVGGLVNLGTISSVSNGGIVSVADVEDYFEVLTGVTFTAEDDMLPFRGHYVIASENMTITNATSQFVANFEEGETGDTSDKLIEQGDWIIISQWLGKPIFGIINQTYRDATTDLKGIAQLSSANQTGTISNKVITETALGNMMVAEGASLNGTTNPNKIAPAKHVHTDLYQTKHAQLTSLSTIDNEASGVFSFIVNSEAGVTKKTVNDSRNALGLEIGTDIQAYSSELTSLAALTTTGYGRNLLTLADGPALRTTAGLVLGSDVQAYDVKLNNIAAGSAITNMMLVGTAPNTLGYKTASEVRTLLDVYTETEVDNELALRPRIYYDTVPGTRQTGDITFDVV